MKEEHSKRTRHLSSLFVSVILLSVFVGTLTPEASPIHALSTCQYQCIHVGGHITYLGPPNITSPIEFEKTKEDKLEDELVAA